MATFTSYLQGTPSWIEHSCSDQDAAKQFYGGLFGWSFDDRPMGDGDEAGIYSMAQIDGDPVAGLGPVMDPNQPASWGVYLAADDVDAAVQAAQDGGGSVLAGPFDVMEAGRMAWVADPQGAAVGLWQAGETIGAQRANEPGTNIWNELVVPDVQAALPFYERMLGITSDTQEWPGMGSYTTLQVDGRSVGGACPPMAEGTPPHWNLYFNVDSADDTATRVKELGGEVMAEPFDVPGVGRMAVFADPTGAVFNVMQNPDEEKASD